MFGACPRHIDVLCDGADQQRPSDREPGMRLFRATRVFCGQTFWGLVAADGAAVMTANGSDFIPLRVPGVVSAGADETEPVVKLAFGVAPAFVFALTASGRLFHSACFVLLCCSL
jgi:hypothetical protein